jgi:hypothetical protein
MIEQGIWFQNILEHMTHHCINLASHLNDRQ